MPALHLPASHSSVVDCCFPLAACCALLKWLASCYTQRMMVLLHLAEALSSFLVVILLAKLVAFETDLQVITSLLSMCHRYLAE